MSEQSLHKDCVVEIINHYTHQGRQGHVISVLLKNTYPSGMAVWKYKVRLNSGEVFSYLESQLKKVENSVRFIMEDE